MIGSFLRLGDGFPIFLGPLGPFGDVMWVARQDKREYREAAESYLDLSIGASSGSEYYYYYYYHYSYYYYTTNTTTTTITTTTTTAATITTTATTERKFSNKSVGPLGGPLGGPRLFFLEKSSF